MNKHWVDQALKRSCIKGEHSYLEAIEDFKQALIRDVNIKHKNSNEARKGFIELIQNCKP